MELPKNKRTNAISTKKDQKSLGKRLIAGLRHRKNNRRLDHIVPENKEVSKNQREVSKIQEPA